MSSEPPFFHQLINAWKSIPIPRFEHEGNLPLASPSSITRTRSLTLALPQSHGSDRLPLYLNTTEKEKLDYHLPRKSPSNLSAKIVCMVFAALANQTMSTSKNQPSSILGPAIVIAIAASLFVMLVSNNDTIKPSYLRLVPIMEIIGFLSFILVVLLMAKPLFPGDSTLWTIMAVLAMASTVLALRMRFST